MTRSNQKQVVGISSRSPLIFPTGLPVLGKEVLLEVQVSFLFMFANLWMLLGCGIYI